MRFPWTSRKIEVTAVAVVDIYNNYLKSFTKNPKLLPPPEHDIASFNILLPRPKSNYYATEVYEAYQLSIFSMLYNDLPIDEEVLRENEKGKMFSLNILNPKVPSDFYDILDLPTDSREFTINIKGILVYEDEFFANQPRFFIFHYYSQYFKKGK